MRALFFCVPTLDCSPCNTDPPDVRSESKMAHNRLPAASGRLPRCLSCLPLGLCVSLTDQLTALPHKSLDCDCPLPPPSLFSLSDHRCLPKSHLHLTYHPHHLISRPPRIRSTTPTRISTIAPTSTPFPSFLLDSTPNASASASTSHDASHPARLWADDGGADRGAHAPHQGVCARLHHVHDHH